MKFITIERAQEHVKSEGDDDELLTLYIDAAEAAILRLANRNIYKDANALNVAIAAVPAAMATAWTAYDAAIATAMGLDERGYDDAAGRAKAALRSVQDNADKTVVGLVITDDMIAAILLIVGHLYRNREEVQTGQQAAATQLPMGAEALMLPYRWVGPL